MKFIIAVVMLAVAVSVEAAWGPVLEVSHWGGHPGGVVDNGQQWGGSWGGDWSSGAWDGNWGGSSGSPHGAPHINLHQGHGIAGGYGGAGDHGHDGKYVAANRGSVHVAPLVGHIQSVSSKNLEPAPGTTW